MRFFDVDKDLNPDLIVNGTTDFYDGDSSFTNIYINDISSTNQKPSEPSTLTSFVVSTVWSLHGVQELMQVKRPLV